MQKQTTRRGWLGAIAGIAAGIGADGLARRREDSSAAPASLASAPDRAGDSHRQTSPSLLVKPAALSVKRHG